MCSLQTPRQIPNRGQFRFRLGDGIGTGRALDFLSLPHRVVCDPAELFRLELGILRAGQGTFRLGPARPDLGQKLLRLDRLGISNARAASTIGVGNPSRFEIASALDCPGMPIERR